MSVNGQNFTLVAGDSATVRFTALDAGVALNLTGATIRWQVKRFPSDTAAPIIEKHTSGGGLVVVGDALDGIFEVTLDPVDSAAVPLGRYSHAAAVIDSGLEVSTIATGFVVVRPRVVVTGSSP